MTGMAGRNGGLCGFKRRRAELLGSSGEWQLHSPYGGEPATTGALKTSETLPDHERTDDVAIPRSWIVESSSFSRVPGHCGWSPCCLRLDGQQSRGRRRSTPCQSCWSRSRPKPMRTAPELDATACVHQNASSPVVLVTRTDALVASPAAQ